MVNSLKDTKCMSLSLFTFVAVMRSSHHGWEAFAEIPRDHNIDGSSIYRDLNLQHYVMARFW